VRISAKHDQSFVVRALWLSAIIGVTTAVVLAWVRGGYSDMPSVLLEFWAFGFLVALILFWVFRPATFQSIETAIQKLLPISKLRNILALLFASSLLIWSGPVLRSAGYAGWLLLIPLIIFSSLIICFVAARFPILFGALVAGLVALSSQMDYVRFEWTHPHRTFEQLWSIFWKVFDPLNFLLASLVSLGLSLTVSLPIYIQRRKVNILS
jgi:hypothetical protein